MKFKYHRAPGLATLLFLSVSAFAQSSGSGIYKTADDFKTGKLALAVDCKTENHKIKLNNFFGKSFITVVHDSKDYKFEKKDIYAYQLCNGEIYRFVSNIKNFLILNPKEQILIYKEAVVTGKGSLSHVDYFFSKDVASNVQPLTMENLKAAFPTNHKFQYSLDSAFENDANLARYDSFHKMYKINRVLEANKQ
jgi:hypothetical protein